MSSDSTVVSRPKRKLPFASVTLGKVAAYLSIALIFFACLAFLIGRSVWGIALGVGAIYLVATSVLLFARASYLEVVNARKAWRKNNLTARQRAADYIGSRIGSSETTIKSEIEFLGLALEGMSQEIAQKLEHNAKSSGETSEPVSRNSKHGILSNVLRRATLNTDSPVLFVSDGLTLERVKQELDAKSARKIDQFDVTAEAQTPLNNVAEYGVIVFWCTLEVMRAAKCDLLPLSWISADSELFCGPNAAESVDALQKFNSGTDIEIFAEPSTNRMHRLLISRRLDN